MRTKIRQQAPGFIFTPNHPYHRVSKSSEIHQLETGEVYEYSTSKKIWVTLKCVKDSFSRKGLLFAKRSFIFAKRTFSMAKTIHKDYV